VRWFRMYTRVVHDPKLQRLPLPLFRAWVNILCLAKDNEGRVPSVEDLSFHLKVPNKAVQKILDGLQKAELIDRTKNGFIPHDWDDWQYQSDSSTARVRKHRSERSAPLVSFNGTEKKEGVGVPVTTSEQNGNVSVTPSETEAETEAETEQTDGGAGDVDQAVEQIRDWLHEFMLGEWERPDRFIGEKIYHALNGRPLQDFKDLLLGMHARGERPKKSWVWFASVVQRKFQ
jgi:hypothetical protein